MAKHNEHCKINKNVKIILNPIHEKMTRFEMKLKRQFLSKNNRWVISVWNKGKINSKGKPIGDGVYPWTVYKNGRPIQVPILKKLESKSNIEMGIVDIQ